MLGVLIEQTGEQGSVLANSLKTIMTRITKAGKASGEFSENISKAEGALRAVGVEVRKDAKNFRDMTDILYDLSKVWNNLDSVTQSNVSFELAGTRQTNVLRTLLNNMDEYYNMLGKVDEAEGITERNQEIFADSLQGHLNDLTNSLEALYTTMANSNDIKIAIDALTILVDVVNDLVGALGAVPIIMGIIGGSLGALIGGTPIGALIGGTPIGALIGGISFAVGEIIKVVDSVSPSVDDATESAKESKAEFERLTKELETTEDKLANVKEKIDLINSGELKVSSNNDLEILKQQETSLENQVAYLREKKKLEGEEAEKSAIKALKNELGFWDRAIGKDQRSLPDQVKSKIISYNYESQQYIKANQGLNDLRALKDKSPNNSIIDKKIAEQQKKVDEYKTCLKNAERDITDTYGKIVNLSDKVVGATPEGEEYKKIIQDTQGIYSEWADNLQKIEDATNEVVKPTEEVTDATQNFAKATKDDAIKAVDGLNDGFIALQKIYQDVSEGKGINLKDLTSKDMEGAFGGLESWREFRETIAEYPNDLKKCQSAFNKLTQEYIAQSDVLDTVNDDTVQLIQNLLREQGVTVDNIDEFTKYALVKQQANQNGLNTSNDVKQLENLCNALGITGQMLKDIKELEDLLDWGKNGGGSNQDRASVDTQIKKLQEKLSNPNAYAEFNFNKITDKKSSSSQKDKWLEEYKKQLAILKDQREMSQISEAEFYEKSNALYAKYLKGRSKYTEESAEAEKNLHNDWNKVYSEERKVIDELYNDGRISASDYYNALAGLASKYYSASRGAETYGEYLDELKEKQREVADGMKNMYSSAINGAVKILSDEISDLQDAQNKATEGYKKKQKAIDKEIKGYEKQKKAIEKQKKLLNEQKNAIKEQIDAIKEANDAREREIALEEALEALNKATNQKNQMTWDAENKQWTYKANDTDIKNARQKVDDAQQKIELADLEAQIDKIEKQVKGLDKQTDAIDEIIDKLKDEKEAYSDLIEQTEEYYKTMIDGLKDYMKQWQKLAESVDKQKSLELLKSMGISEQDLLNSSQTAFNNIKDSYIDLLNGIKTGNGVVLTHLKNLNTVDTSKAVNNINNLNDTTTELLNDTEPNVNAYVQLWDESGNSLNELYEKTWIDGFDNLTNSLSAKMDNIVAFANGMVSEIVSACTQAKNALDSLSGMKSNIPSVSSLLGGKSFANGTNGRLGASSYNTLVGEMGAELVVDTKHGGYSLVNRPTIVDLPEGSIVFNNEQTMEILRNKKAIARGNALANGTWQNNNLSFDANSLVSGLSLQGIGNSNATNSTSITIGDIILHGVQNVDDLSVAIEKRLPNLLTQKLNRI